MPTVTRVEKRKRGIIGWFFLLLFLGFNALMLFALISGLGDAGQSMQGMTNEYERAGAEVGTALGAMMLIMIWAAGALILGLFVMFTRGKKVIVETSD